jgi:thiol-disulfide isomerase/thioredoxin
MSKFANSKVVSLTDKNINNMTITKSKGKPGLLMCYFDWCGYCQMLAPTMKKLAEKSGITVYALEGSKGEQTFAKIGIVGVPHLLFVKSNGKIDKSKVYKGDRTLGDLYKFIQKYSKITGGCGCTGGKSTKAFKKILGGARKKPAKKPTKKPVRKPAKKPVRKPAKKPVRK